MSSGKHGKVTDHSARQWQPAMLREEARQSETRPPQPMNDIGLAGSASPTARAVQLQRLASQTPACAGRAARQLQRAYGNHYVAQLAQQAQQGGTAPLVVQPKLTVTPPDDQYEDEADRVAGQVMRALDTSQPDKYEDEQDRPAGQVMRKDVSAAASGAGTAVSSDVEAAIEGARSGGQPLPAGTRAAMESAFGADFGGVRIHTDSQSDTLNESLSARAFTTAKDIFFGQGEYSPGSAEGERLLAHELTHVVQQLPDAEVDGASLPFLSISNPDPEQRVQRVETRSKKRKHKAPATASDTDAPTGYVSLTEFNKNQNKYGRYSGLSGRNYDDIYVDIYQDKVFLWWSNPSYQIDEFVYEDTREDDIATCKETKDEPGYTWHHTGYQHDNQSVGVMQLVPTAQHASIPHFGGRWVADRT